MIRMDRRGSQAVEFALIFPVFLAIEEIDGYSPSTKQLQCSIEAPTVLLSGFVPLLPDSVTAKSTWPVEPFTNYELLEELGY